MFVPDVMGVLDGQQAKKLRHFKQEFAFSGLLNCGRCGCALNAEIKKRRYLYYNCTVYSGKCPERYMRREVLEAGFSELLGQLTFDHEVLEWVREALRDSHAAQRSEQVAAIARHQADYGRLLG